ncbi:MGMT family protein [Qiania dongpingensis]|uniref:MGMT family protein n=1 Tax=Qiania dongpingensis TaxID=2763669 RepID=A0A7G9G1M3_9FIRM|nr:MGMT family protein [Qiania dongpingensis]QNM04705.1 MGMT family protein [Qiania dongpingensis]
MDFYKRAAEVCRRIPRGTVATYGQIALLCGFPKNARQVGFALGRRLMGRDIPAHRVVNSKGYLSGAASFDTPDLQKLLLEEEGIRVNAERTVDLKRYGWNNSLEDALELRSFFDKHGI